MNISKRSLKDILKIIFRPGFPVKEDFKLDMVFLRSFEKNPKTSLLMSHIVEGTKSMGLVSLTEGVETEGQYEFLKQIGCDKAQGYYFGKPMPMDETKAFTMAKGMTWETYNN